MTMESTSEKYHNILVMYPKFHDRLYGLNTDKLTFLKLRPMYCICLVDSHYGNCGCPQSSVFRFKICYLMIPNIVRVASP